MTHTATLLDFLTRAEAYPHTPDQIEVRQTHISILFFADDRVYKLKKAVDHGFLDFRALRARRHFCHEEVRLNRRLARSMYLGVRCIVRDDRGMIRLGDHDDPDTDLTDGDEVIDYVVEMKRLPESRMLPALLENNTVGEQEIEAIADVLAAFHQHCTNGPDVNQHGTAESLRRQLLENIQGIQKQGNSLTAADNEMITRIRDWGLLFLQRHHMLIAQRINEGRIREGHGDLHAGNICILESSAAHHSIRDRLIMYDCIEFSKALRCRDVAGEVAFLAMDLDHRGHAELGRVLARQYAEAADDLQLLDMIDFFKVHFAVVRSKVASLTSRDDGIAENDRQAARRDMKRYLHLAVGYLVRPALILLCGLPATGKSTLARVLARPLNATILRSDVIRKELLGLAPHERADEHAYADNHTERTYERIEQLALDALSSGESVVVDATLSTQKRRQQLIKLAARMGTPWALVHATATEATIRKRMAARQDEHTEVSDADWRVYQQLRESFETPTEISHEHAITITADDEPEAIVADVLTRLLRSSGVPDSDA